MTQKVYVIDDEGSIRELIKQLLQIAGLAVETYASPMEFLDVYSENMKGCVVLDVRMARMSGPQLQQRLNEMGCQLPIIFVTGHADVKMAVEALKDGAFDFVQKPFDEAVLIACVKKALAKNSDDLLLKNKSSVIRERLKTLSKRENEVVAKLLEGKSSKLIARELDISPRTVDVHRQNVFFKLEVKSVAALVRDVTQLNT